MAPLSRFDLPGFSLPLNYAPPRENHRRTMFRNALDYNDIDDGGAGRFNTIREILMMQVMNSITDKAEWERKVFDDEITSAWRKEITDSGKDVTPMMMDWIIKELQFKADIFQKTGEIVAFDAGVVKSDTAISAELQQALQVAVRPLEHIPEAQKDYHPGSDNKVVDLVHPSLFPVVYGRTRILPDKVIGLDDCLHNVGSAKLLSLPPEDQKVLLYRDPNSWRNMQRERSPYSRNFQWMPCDVKLTGNDGCRIVSYINNLHPTENRDLYGILEKIIARTIPLWDTALTYAGNKYNRIVYDQVEYLDHPDPEPKAKDEEEGSTEEFWDRHGEWEKTRPIKLPEPGIFKTRKFRSNKKANLRKRFSRNGLQVIVKLANIQLTPEKPDYDGGSWHVEGQLNEHICASAIYYYDSENITDSSLSFRQRGSTNLIEVGYEQDRHEFLQPVFGFADGRGDTDVTQFLGSVSTHEGRLLAFPNILQHRVSPFSLADRSKSGHRKILALFLVDPNLRIISSANIPPQREDWWKESHQTINQLLRGRLSAELPDMVVDGIDPISPMTMEEAKQYRLELMEERKATSDEQVVDFETGEFNLCEH